MDIRQTKAWQKIKEKMPRSLYRALLNIVYIIRGYRYRGNSVQCLICQKSFSRFISRYADKECPRCGSLTRHRVLYLFLRKKTDFFRDHLTVLHFSPAFCLFDKFKQLDNIKYHTGDLRPVAAEEVMDINNIKYPDEHFDVVLSSHVLEHVDDDLLAMGECYRVQKQSGWSIHLVPIDYSRKSTLEDESILTPEARLKKYGQHDHQRLYGTDYVERLESVGFCVKPWKISDFVDDNDIEKYQLDNKMEVFFCRR